MLIFCADARAVSWNKCILVPSHAPGNIKVRKEVMWQHQQFDPVPSHVSANVFGIEIIINTCSVHL